METVDKKPVAFDWSLKIVIFFFLILRDNFIFSRTLEQSIKIQGP